MEKFSSKFGTVLLLDALGVSTLSVTTSKDFLEKSLQFSEVITDMMDQMVRGGQEWNMPVSKSEMFTFGDTLLFTWEVTMGEDITQFVNTMVLTGSAVNVGLASAFDMGLLFRGALAIGEFVTSTNIAIGPAVADAARWYEQSDQIGVILTPKTGVMWEMMLEANKEDPLIQDIYVKYSVKLKDKGSMNLWTIPWPIHFSMRIEADEEIKLKPKDAFMRTIASFDISPGSESKYLNTIDYFDNIMESHRIDKGAIKAHKHGVQDGLRMRKKPHKRGKIK